MAGRPIQRTDADGVEWELVVQHDGDGGLWGDWLAVSFPPGYDGSSWAPQVTWSDPDEVREWELFLPAPGYCAVCNRWAFLDGTVKHSGHCSQRYWYVGYGEEQGRARRGQAVPDKELLRAFKAAGLKSTHEWQVLAPRHGLPNWSTYQRRFRDDSRRREGESIFDFVARISKRVR